jgi:hypothetical protein
MAVLDEFNKINDSFGEVYENADGAMMDRLYRTKLMHWVLGKSMQTRNCGCFTNSEGDTIKNLVGNAV